MVDSSCHLSRLCWLIHKDPSLLIVLAGFPTYIASKWVWDRFQGDVGAHLEIELCSQFPLLIEEIFGATYLECCGSASNLRDPYDKSEDLTWNASFESGNPPDPNGSREVSWIHQYRLS